MRSTNRNPDRDAGDQSDAECSENRFHGAMRDCVGSLLVALTSAISHLLVAFLHCVTGRFSILASELTDPLGCRALTLTQRVDVGRCLFTCLPSSSLD